MSADPILSPDDVAEIVAILDASTYERLDIATPRFRLRVARSGEGWTQELEWRDEAAGAAPEERVAAPAEEAVEEGMAVVRAPLPGTFYHQPQPGAPAFVKVGDKVEADAVVGIVETMKLMNTVHAGVAGTIAAIVVANAQPVKEGAGLVHIRPAL